MRKPKGPLRLFVLPEHIVQYSNWLNEETPEDIFVISFDKTPRGRVEIGFPKLLKVKDGKVSA